MSAPMAAQTLTWVGRHRHCRRRHHGLGRGASVVAAMGDRFVLIRPKQYRAQKGWRGAIRNTGDEIGMREELAAVVGGVVGHMDPAGHRLNDDEIDQLLNAADIVTMARTAVERDYRGDSCSPTPRKCRPALPSSWRS